MQHGAHCRGIPKLAECRQGTIADHGQCVLSMFIQDSQDFRVLRVSQFDQRLSPCDVVLVIEDIGGFQLLANFSELRGGELAGGSRRGIVWNRPFGRRLNHLLQALVVERSSNHGGLGRWILGRRRRWSLRSGHGRWSIRERSGMTSAARGVVRRDRHRDGRRALWALHSLAPQRDAHSNGRATRTGDTHLVAVRRTGRATIKRTRRRIRFELRRWGSGWWGNDRDCRSNRHCRSRGGLTLRRLGSGTFQNLIASPAAGQVWRNFRETARTNSRHRGHDLILSSGRPHRRAGRAIDAPLAVDLAELTRPTVQRLRKKAKGGRPTLNASSAPPSAQHRGHTGIQLSCITRICPSTKP